MRPLQGETGPIAGVAGSQRNVYSEGQGRCDAVTKKRVRGAEREVGQRSELKGHANMQQSRLVRIVQEEKY